MLKLSRKVEYAIIAILYMAEKPVGELSTAKELAMNFRIPMELMGKVLQLLARKNLIVSEQGVKGGYRVARSLKEISMKEVLLAVTGPVQLVSCVEGQTGSDCNQFQFCNIRRPMEMIHLKLHEFFEQFTLQDFFVDQRDAIPVPFIFSTDDEPAPANGLQ